MVSLEELDEEPVTQLDRAAAAENSASISTSLIAAHSRKGRGNPSNVTLYQPPPITIKMGQSSTALRQQQQSPGGGAPSDGGFSFVQSERAGIGGGGGANELSASEDGGWWVEIEEIELDHQHLRRLHNLERLVNLRRASFFDNELPRLEGLDAATKLEELCLEENRLLKIEGGPSLSPSLPLSLSLPLPLSLSLPPFLSLSLPPLCLFLLSVSLFACLN